MGGAVPPLPNTPSWRGAQLGGARGQLYLYISIAHIINEQYTYASAQGHNCSADETDLQLRYHAPKTQFLLHFFKCAHFMFNHCFFFPEPTD
jgi:hypothetical protein